MVKNEIERKWEKETEIWQKEKSNKRNKRKYNKKRKHNFKIFIKFF